LPRYQWTAVDGLTAFSHRINRSNGLAFLALILLHLRALGIDQKVTFQTDWGQEFGRRSAFGQIPGPAWG